MLDVVSRLTRCFSMEEKILDVESITKYLKEESDGISRFPARVVFTNSIIQYKKMVEEMALNAKKIFLREFCNGDDTIPNIDELIDLVKKSVNEVLVVPSIGEYLRFAIKYERISQKFASLIRLETNSKTRLWLPIYCAKTYFDEVVGQLDFRHADHFYEIKDEDKVSPFNVTVFSPSFEEIIVTQNIIPNLKSWFSLWDEGLFQTNKILITKKHALIDNTGGIYSISKITSPYYYILDNITNISQLNEELGNEKMWSMLAKFVNPNNKTIKSLILSGLNIREFEPYSILKRWDELAENDCFGKWLFWLWYKLNNTSEHSYISYAISLSNNFKDIPLQIEIAIMNKNAPQISKNEWLIQRSKALLMLNIRKRSSKFWNQFESIQDIWQKLRLLTAQTFEEKVKIVEVVSEVLKSGEGISSLTPLLNEKYAELYDYLNPQYKFEYKELNAYFDYYKLLKIKNIFDADIQTLNERCDLEIIPARGNLLTSIKAKEDAYFLWIDGMGLEWVDLIIKKIESKCANIEYKIQVAGAKNPTITSHNNAWDSMDAPFEKYDKLDSKSHIKDKSEINSYFEVFVQQLDIMNEIADKIASLLQSHNTLVITSDHGLSRMAALAFHELRAVEPPPKAIVENLGRYCILENDRNLDISRTYHDDNYLLFKSHNHFTSSGNAPGEIHGGMTPEEFLVPIIMIKNKKSLVHKSRQPIKYSIIENKVKPNDNGIVLIKIRFESEIDSLKATINKIEGECRFVSNGLWEISFIDLKPNAYKLKLYPNNLYNEDETEIFVETRGFIEDNLF